jgi:hypothetical protein
MEADEEEAVEGLLLADTPTTLAAIAQKEAANDQLAAAADAMEAEAKMEEDSKISAEMRMATEVGAGLLFSVEDRMAEEAGKASARAAVTAAAAEDRYAALTAAEQKGAMAPLVEALSGSHGGATS